MQQNLDGLIERLNIINREPLAHALESRLDELQTREDSKWRPEILSLLLQLAERPAELSTLEDLERVRLKTPEAEKLTWREIVGDEEADADALWGRFDDDEDADLSEREYSGEEDESNSDATDQTSTSVFGGVSEGAKFESLLLEPDVDILDELKQAQQWRTEDDEGYAVPLTEDQAVREILHMLRGLPSQIFIQGRQTVELRSSPRFYIEGLSSSGFEELLDNFAGIGDILQSLRQYLLSKQDSALQQTLAQCIEKELRVFSQTLTSIENTIAKPSGPTPVSFFDLQDRIETAAYAVTSLASITDVLSSDHASHDYDISNHLYAQVCEAQAKGDQQSFVVLQETFSDCLQTYLRPIQAWITGGILQDDVKFVQQRDKAVDISTFWEQQYSLHTQDGASLAPDFMQEFVPTIFSLGKQVAFMDVLGVEIEGLDEEREPRSEKHMLDPLSTANIADLTPFSITVSQVLHNWVHKHRQKSSATLCSHILYVCGLSRALDTLAHIYLSANGSLFQQFADSVFARLDAGKSTWADSLALETLAREAFAAVVGTDIRNLNAQNQRSTQASKSEKSPRNISTSVKALGNITLTLAISPALQNIIRPSQIHVYQSANHLLLQLYRSTSMLASLDITILQNTNISFPLRQRLLHLITTIRSHVLHTGIAAASTALKEQMSRAEGVDEMISAHASFIARLEQCCFANTDAPVTNVRRLVVNLCDVAVNFAKLWQTSREQDRHDPGLSSKDDCSDDEWDEGAMPGPSVAGAEEVGPIRLRQMLRQVEHLQMLLISALRSAGRLEVGVSSGLNSDAAASQDFGMLAEELESSLGSRGRKTTSKS